MPAGQKPSHTSVVRQADGAKTQLLQAVNEAGSVDVLLFDVRVVNDTVERAEQENSDEARGFDGPRAGARASLK